MLGYHFDDNAAIQVLLELGARVVKGSLCLVMNAKRLGWGSEALIAGSGSSGLWANMMSFTV
jgi:hypothetical protein